MGRDGGGRAGARMNDTARRTGLRGRGGRPRGGHRGELHDGHGHEGIRWSHRVVLVKVELGIGRRSFWRGAPRGGGTCAGDFGQVPVRAAMSQQDVPASEALVSSAPASSCAMQIDADWRPLTCEQRFSCGCRCQEVRRAAGRRMNARTYEHSSQLNGLTPVCRRRCRTK